MMIRRERPEGNERILHVALTGKGKALKQQAEQVPVAMQNCIPLEKEELLMLKHLLCKAMERMHAKDD